MLAPKHYALLVGLITANGWLASCVWAETGLALDFELKRSAFYRGEEIPAVLRVINRSETSIANASLSITAGSVGLISRVYSDIPGHSTRAEVFRLPSRVLKVGDYALRARLYPPGGDTKETIRKLALAKRPNADRLIVWLWGGGGNQWYFDHGFTTWLGPYWRPEGVPFTEDWIQLMEQGLVVGGDVGLTANGGLADIDPNQINDPAAAHPNVRENHEGKIANPHHPEVARLQDNANRRLMELAINYPQIKTAFFNTEVIDALRTDTSPLGRERMKRALGFTDEEVGEPRYVAPGVLADDDRGYLLHKYIYKEGNGLSTANRRTAEMIHRYRPDILTINDPFRETALYDLFPGLDVISTWTYTNPDPKLMLFIETLRAACKPTGQIPLHTITMLNYPGELAPTEEWMLMGPGRMKVATWINLSRAPKMIGYYYSSACPPENADTFEVPYSTSLAIKELSEKVFKPYGPLLGNLDVAPRRIAVLSSAAARLYGTSPNLLGGYDNLQPYHFYTVLALAHYQADIVFDETIERYGLDDYDVLVLPKCDLLTETVYRKVLEFQKRGGLVIVDQYLGPAIPDAVRFDFDFTYRKKVNANAIAKGTVIADWNDQIDPASAELEKVEGVTALQDQKIMESYARDLKSRIETRIQPDINCDEPTVLLNWLEKGDTKYLAVINDKRTYDDRVGKYLSVLEKLVPQSVTLHLRQWDHSTLHVYDLLSRKELEVSSADGVYSFPVELSELGGTLLSLRPAPLEEVVIQAPGKAKLGATALIQVRVKQEGNLDAAGPLPIQVTLTDPNGRSNDLSDYYCSQQGTLTLDFVPALNDTTGVWRVEALDLTAGLSAQREFLVVE